MKVFGKIVVAADVTDISKVEMKQLLEQYFLLGDGGQTKNTAGAVPIEAAGPMKEMVWSWFNLMSQVMGNLELVALRAKQGDINA